MTFPSLEEEIRKFRCIDYENDQNHTIIAPLQHERTNVFYSICYFDPNSFCAFHYYVKGAKPSLSSPDGTSLIFYHSEFWTTCNCPEKQSCPEIFHCVEIFFISQDLQLSLTLKTECALKIFTLFNILFTFRIFEQLALALKNRVCPEFTAMNIYFLSFRILNNLRLPEKQSLPWNFSLYWIYIFYYSKFCKTCACPEKQSLPWKFSLYLIYFLDSGFLSNLRLLWKTDCALNSLYWIYIFIIQNFEQLELALKNRVCPEFFNPGHCRPPPRTPLPGIAQTPGYQIETNRGVKHTRPWNSIGHNCRNKLRLCANVLSITSFRRCAPGMSHTQVVC